MCFKDEIAGGCVSSDAQLRMLHLKRNQDALHCRLSLLRTGLFSGQEWDHWEKSQACNWFSTHETKRVCVCVCGGEWEG